MKKTKIRIAIFMLVGLFATEENPMTLEEHIYGIGIVLNAIGFLISMLPFILLILVGMVLFGLMKFRYLGLGLIIRLFNKH
jgi:hypothetical protein